MLIAEEIIEPIPVIDIFVTGVGKVEVLGRNARITLYVEQDGERVAVGKIIVEMDNLPNCIIAIMKATWHRLTHMPIMEIESADGLVRH